jgi:hypothetical protein
MTRNEWDVEWGIVVHGDQAVVYGMFADSLCRSANSAKKTSKSTSRK